MEESPRKARRKNYAGRISQNAKRNLGIILAKRSNFGCGDIGSWEKSTRQYMNLARISLESRRGWILDVAIYDLWWNENEQKKQQAGF